MSNEKYTRTEMLIGKNGIERLKSSHVAVFGIGGVGSYAVEALARSGVGHISVIDADKVNESNINRQLIATEKTVGIDKVEAVRARIKEINSDIKIDCYPLFFSEETADMINLSDCDYIIDAIDSVKSKIALISLAKNKNIPIISSMGTGNKLDPTQFEVADISKTSVCPLARIMRKQLGLRGIKHLKVVYSKELPAVPNESNEKPNPGKHTIPASISFVPSVAGLIIAGEVIKDIIKDGNS